MAKKDGEIEQRERIEREAEKRRREIDGRLDENPSETTSQFNAVEGVPPHRAAVNEKPKK